MKPEYKTIKTLAPHCPKCGEQLMGDNSQISPWRCNCGKWMGDWTHPGEYEIVEDKGLNTILNL